MIPKLVQMISLTKYASVPFILSSTWLGVITCRCARARLFSLRYFGMCEDYLLICLRACIPGISGLFIGWTP